MDANDVSCRRMAAFLGRCERHYPVSDRYVRDVHDSPDKMGRDEREHMVSWFESNATTGFGSYSRQRGNDSAKRCYNRLQNAASLLWIAEAVGVPAELVERAYDAAVEAGDRRRACGAIRRVVPWSEVYERMARLGL